jgi:hypothetical protein
VPSPTGKSKRLEAALQTLPQRQVGQVHGRGENDNYSRLAFRCRLRVDQAPLEFYRSANHLGGEIVSKKSDGKDLVAAVSEEELDRAIKSLRALHRAHSVAHAVSVGRTIVELFYGGDYAAARSRDPSRHARYRALVQRRPDELADLALPDRNLRRCVAASDVWQGLPESVRSKLAILHLEGLAAIQDSEIRKEMAAEAASLEWTGDQVKKAVADQKRKARGEKRKPGRKKKPAVLKTAGAARASLKKLVDQKELVEKLAPERLAELKALVQGMQELLAQLA